MDPEPPDFITIREVDDRVPFHNLQRSYLMTSKRRNALVVVGVLPPGYEFQPASVEQADRLIAWLQDWKEARR